MKLIGASFVLESYDRAVSTLELGKASAARREHLQVAVVAIAAIVDRKSCYLYFAPWLDLLAAQIAVAVARTGSHCLQSYTLTHRQLVTKSSCAGLKKAAYSLKELK